jgi:TRAP-type mannitol/chloroaromatic compound transport system permease small subunit
MEWASAAGMLLVLPVSLLLALQWPLRDLLHAYSREANDLAQWLFALYVTLALVCATRRRAHLAADALARRYPPRLRALLSRTGNALALIPWSLFLLYAASPVAWNSLRQFESFPDTDNPGYFIIKLCVWLMGALVLAQALIDVLRPQPGRPPD